MEQNLYFDGAKSIRLTQLGTISSGQDGAISNGYIFRFDQAGLCRVFCLSTLEKIAEFTLEKADLLAPHSNSVCFGPNRWEEDDEFPIIYTNIYNNYSSRENRLEGVCCAYRIVRDGTQFTSQLLQVIQVDFVHDSRYWCSESVKDVRPYGNFVVDGDDLIAFVMRDETHATRFFRFALPKITEGVMDDVWGVPVAHLTPEHIEQQFDECYVNYMQGATCHNGILYSVEGFDMPNDNAHPYIHIFDTKQEKLVLAVDLTTLGLSRETEFVDVYQDTVYYGDCHGNFYQILFEA